MASAAQAQEYIEDAESLISDLQEFGHLVSFGIRPESANGRGARGAYSEVGQANVLPIEWRQTHPEMDILADDIFLITSNEVDLKACEFMVRNGDMYSLYRVESFTPDNATTVFYEIQGRRC